MHISKINNTNFKAIPLAKVKVKGLDKTYKLFEVTKADNDYLMSFYENLNLEKLMKGLQDYEYNIWDNIVESALKVANMHGRKTIIETCNDKPCGLLNYTEGEKNFILIMLLQYQLKKIKKFLLQDKFYLMNFLKEFLIAVLIP